MDRLRRRCRAVILFQKSKPFFYEEFSSSSERRSSGIFSSLMQDAGRGAEHGFAAEPAPQVCVDSSPSLRNGHPKSARNWEPSTPSLRDGHPKSAWPPLKSLNFRRAACGQRTPSLRATRRAMLSVRLPVRCARVRSCRTPPRGPLRATRRSSRRGGRAQPCPARSRESARR